VLDVKFKFVGGHTSDRSWLVPSPLRQLVWHVTYDCNHHCPVCFIDAGRPHLGELTTAEALRLVEAARDAGVEDIIVSGGEPFARGDLLEILAHMGRLGITARIASNGSRLTDDVLGQLSARTMAKSFQISLDTLDPVVYGMLHGVPEDALDRALDALARIQQHGLHTTISTRLTPETLPGIPALLDRAYAESWRTVTVHFPIHTGRARKAFPQDADFFSLLQPSFAHFARLPGRWLVETYIPWAPYHPVVRRYEAKVRFVHRGCRAGRDRLTITPCGWLSPCVCMDVPAVYAGHVRTDGLREVFENAPVCRMLRRPQEHGICVDCEHVSECGGGCRAAAFTHTGRADGTDPTCPVRHGRRKGAE
jgi:radical SAM protein with 4Fe4S-binding SPASM domain